jgi:hypothetical protein
MIVPPIISVISRETGEQRWWVCDHAHTHPCKPSHDFLSPCGDLGRLARPPVKSLQPHHKDLSWSFMIYFDIFRPIHPCAREACHCWSGHETATAAPASNILMSQKPQAFANSLRKPHLKNFHRAGR